jgi:hypothetical protein
MNLKGKLNVKKNDNAKYFHETLKKSVLLWFYLNYMTIVLIEIREKDLGIITVPQNKGVQ